MSDWAVGDKLVCIDAAPNPNRIRLGFRASVAVTEGAVYTFAGYTSTDIYGDLCCFVTEVAPLNSKRGFLVRRFRKIRPDEQEACEEEFVTLLKRSKQRVEA